MILALAGNVFPVINPNPKVSDGKTVYTSKGNANYLVDNKFNTSSWLSAKDTWIAIPIDSGPSKIFFNWNSPNYPWSNELSPTSCPNSISFPVDYNLLVSSNSTNGTDGDWIIADSIRNNIVCTRGHLINFTGAKWVKMYITNGKGNIDEIQVFDASGGDEDVWFFAGTSISANAFKGTPPAKNFADLINGKHADYDPAMIRGGIGCISSNDFVRNLSAYLKMAGNAHFWAIEMGTNDAWGGSNGNVATFKNNLQIVIDSCKARGIQPVIARVLATNSTAAGWQINADFLKAVDDLTAQNNLVPGPDLYTWFLANPGDLNSDGVHPNANGAASLQRLWAEKMDSLYGGCSATEIVPYLQVNNDEKVLRSTISVYTGDRVILSPTAGPGGTWVWSGTGDFSSSSQEITFDSIQLSQGGNYVVTYTNSNSCSSSYPLKVTVKEKVGITAADLDSNISLFPNPAHDGNVTVSVKGLSGTFQIQIFDMHGKLVFDAPLTQKESKINTGLLKGTYIVKVKNEKDSLNQKLIIE